ncbi:MAG TPA: hypothetical protein VEQ85_01010 [Lacipirellulaceae bacterium]|nr:hypothetical protein [Lacipirellulaceae bacterium]
MSKLQPRRRCASTIVLAALASTLVAHAYGGANYAFKSIVDNQGDLTFTTLGNSFRQLNNSGEVAFQASTLLQHFVYKGNGGALTPIGGPPSFFGINSGYGNGAIRDDGTVVFTGSLTANNGTTFVGAYAGSGGGAAAIYAQAIDPNTDFPELTPLATSTSAAGVTAFLGVRYDYPDLPPGTSRSGYYLATAQGLVTMVEESAEATTSGAAPVVNDAGQAALVMRTGPSGSTIFRYGNGSLTTVATDFTGGHEIGMNGAGDVVFADATTVKLYRNGVTTTLASEANGFHSLSKPGNSDVFINDAGLIAFWGNVTEFEGNSVAWQGIYRGPDVVADRVLVRGDSVLGHVVGSVELLGLNNTGQMLLSMDAASPDPWRALVVATPVREADFEQDGDVDAGDLARWRMHVGAAPTATHSQGDADGDGDVDGGDFVLWQRQLGSAPSNGLATPVPEPSTAWPAALCLAAAGPSLRHRSRGRRLTPRRKAAEKSCGGAPRGRERAGVSLA